MTSITTKLIEEARKLEWIGDNISADSKYKKIKENNIQTDSMAEKYYIIPMVEELTKQAKKYNNKYDHVNSYYNDKLHFSLKVIDEIKEYKYLQIRGFYNVYKREISVLSKKRLAELDFDEQFHSNSIDENKELDKYEHLTLIRYEKPNCSLTIDRNGIIIGETVIKEDELSEVYEILGATLDNIYETLT